MENFKVIKNLDYEFEDKDVKDLFDSMRISINLSKRNDFNFLCLLKELVEKLKADPLSFKNVGFQVRIDNKMQTKSVYSLLSEAFGFSEETCRKYFYISNYLIKFKSKGLDVTGCEIREYKYIYSIFNDFSISKLNELTSLLVWQIDSLVTENILSPNLTVKQIRNIVKKTKELSSKNMSIKKENYVEQITEKQEKEKIEEKPFDVNFNEYSLFDFKSYSKTSLIKIAFDCYTELLSLRKKIKKMKGGAL